MKRIVSLILSIVMVEMFFTPVIQANAEEIPVQCSTVSLGFMHSAAITKDGELWMWGSNRDGQLGDGTNENKNSPVKIMDNIMLPQPQDISIDISLEVRRADSNTQLDYIAYDPDVKSYTPEEVDTFVSLSTSYSETIKNVLIKIILPLGLSFEKLSVVREKTFEIEEFTYFSSICSKVYPIGMAVTGDSKIKLEVSGEGIKSSEYQYSIPIKLCGFEVNKYRANEILYGLNGKTLSSMENTYFADFPGEMLVQAGKANGFENSAQFWKAIQDGVSVINDVSKTMDLAVEKKDLYEAVIWKLLEASADASLISTVDTAIDDLGRKNFSYISDQLKTVYNINLANEKGYSKLSAKEKENFNESVKEYFGNEYGALSKAMKISSVYGKIMDAAKDVEDGVNRLTAYCKMYTLRESMKQVLKEMYQSCPSDNIALKAALLNCVSIMNSDEEQFIARMGVSLTTLAGKSIAEFGVSEMWDSIMKSVKLAHPSVAVLMAAFKTGTFFSNQIFNTDDTVKAFYTMEAGVDVKNTAKSAYEKVKSKYLSDSTELKAEIYNNAVDIMFKMKDEDCDNAVKYIDSVNDSFAGNISALFGNKSLDDAKKSVKAIQTYTREYHNQILKSWIFQLKVDNPKQYEKYKRLLDESNNKTVKKYYIACPVDVYIYDNDGNEVGTIIDGNTKVNNSANITLAAVNDEKYAFLDGNQYTLKYEGTGTGTMDVTITEYDEMHNTAREAAFTDVELKDGTSYISKDSGKICSDNYQLDNNGAVTEPTYDTLDDAVNAFKSMMKIDFDGVLPTEIETETSFGSVVSEWAKDEVEEAYAEDVIPELLIGEDLTKPVNRAEFAAIAVKMYENLSSDISKAGENPFNDIIESDYKNDILKAYKLDITQGTSKNTFEPEINITREQMATMLTRAYKKSEFDGWNLKDDSNYPLNFMGVQKFDDDNEISDYAKESVYFMTRWNVINGVGNNMFAPKGSADLGQAYGFATREQAVCIALRSAKYLK